MNYGELKTRVLNEIFIEGIPENAISVLHSYVSESLYDIQKAVKCYAFANTSVFPHCATYFDCGFTVLPKPSGQITYVYVIDRINPETGLEDPNVDPDYCTKVFYAPVSYANLLAYKKVCERCSGGGIAAVWDTFASIFFGVFRIKRAYPEPTDEGLEAQPKLPEGYHYPQASTDASGRSPRGVYAIHRGRVYIAPWIQSTETVILQFDGIKRNWADADTVDTDPKFIECVRLMVSLRYEQSFGDDANKIARLKAQLYGNPLEVGALEILYSQCVQETRTGLSTDSGANADSAQGIGVGSGAADLYYNQRQEYTASCPSGQSGTPVTAVVEAGTVGSVLSEADANAQALQQAVANANAQISCVTDPITYWNTEQSYTASCAAASGDTPAAEGTPVTVTIPANEYSSIVSQLSADNAALAAATAQANASLTCTFWNAPQEYTSNCIAPATGTPVTEEVAAHSFSSTISQFDADAKALAAVTTLANEALVCDTPPTIYWNTQVTNGVYTIHRVYDPPGGIPPCIRTISVTVIVSPGRFSSIVGVGEANQAALAYANQLAQVRAEQLNSTIAPNCNPLSETVNF